jgi:hypothetical protein
MIHVVGMFTMRWLSHCTAMGAMGFAPRDGGSTEAPGNPVTIAAMVVSCLVAGTLAWAIVTAMRRDRARHGPTVRRLAARLGLSASARVLLGRVARTAAMSSAGSLMISRGCFDAAVKRYAPRGRDAQRLRSIRRKLFG